LRNLRRTCIRRIGRSPAVEWHCNDFRSEHRSSITATRPRITAEHEPPRRGQSPRWREYDPRQVRNFTPGRQKYPRAPEGAPPRLQEQDASEAHPPAGDGRRRGRARQRVAGSGGTYSVHVCRLRLGSLCRQPVTARNGQSHREVVSRRAQLLEADAARPEGQLACRSLYRTPGGGAHLPGLHPNPGTGCFRGSGVDTNASTVAARVLESTWSFPSSIRRTEVRRSPPLGCRGDLTTGRLHRRRPHTCKRVRRDEDARTRSGTAPR